MRQFNLFNFKQLYLAMEENEVDSPSKATSLIASFETNFLGIYAIFHPRDLSGEIACKSSNVAFAACEIFGQHRLDKYESHIIITVFDCRVLTSPCCMLTSIHAANTHPLQDCFSEKRRLHVSSHNSSHALYVCPIIFDRNAHKIPVLIHLADVL